MAARSVTPASWADSLLQRLDVPDSAQNRRAIVAWIQAEGGHWNNSAHFNPLNTTQGAPGASSMNGVGVKAYRDWQQGLDATVKTLRNGRYGPILQALRRGDSAQAVAQAVEQTPWGTGGGVLRTLGSVSGARDGGVAVSGGAGGSGAGGALLEASAGGSAAQGMPQGSEGVTALLQALSARPQQAPSAGVPAPAFSAQAVMPQGAQLPSSGGGPAPKPDVGALLDSIRTVGGDVPQSGGVGGASASVAVGGGGGAGASSSGGGGRDGLGTFDGKRVSAWMVPVLQYAREKGWKGTIQSGYRSDAEQTRIYKSGVRPAALPRSMGGAGSNHSRSGWLQGAIDVTDAAVLDRILRQKHSRLKWAGAADPVHFSVPRNGSY